MIDRYIALGILALVFAAADSRAQPTLTGTPDELRQLLGVAPVTPRLITIRGFAEETAYTDTAVVSLIVSIESRTMAEALELNASLRGTIVGELTGAGVPRDAINNSRFSTSPQFGLFGRNPSTYQVVNRMEVSVTEAAHLTTLGSIVDRNESVSFGGTEFEHSERDAFEDQVRQAAVDDALADERFYENALGLVLRPVAFRSGPVAFTPQPAFGRVLEEVMVTGSRIQAGAAGQLDGGSAQAVPTFDEVRYQSTVEVDFEVGSTE
jgi:hypothetical protein